MRPSDLCSKGLSVLDFLVVCIHHAVVRRAGVGACRAALGAALLLAGLYTLFGDTVLPTVTQRVEDMFNYAG